MRTIPRRAAAAVAAAAVLTVPLAAAAPAGAASAPFAPAETGTVRVVIAEGAGGGEERYVAAGGELLPARTGLPSGTRVTFTRDGGRAVGVARAAGAVQPRATGARPAALAHVVHVVRALNPGQAPDESVSIARVQQALAGANAYWERETAGTLTFRLGEVVPGWTRLPAACSDRGTTIAAGVEAAGLTPGAVPRGQHVLVVVPHDGTCLGYGELGADVHDGGGIVMSAGGSVATEAEVLPVSGLAHELGHNISLDHSGAVRCAGQLDPAYPRLDGCAVAEYGDAFDVMGPSGVEFGRGSLHVVNRVRLGLADVTRVAGSGADTTVELDSLSRSTGVRQGAGVTAPDGQTYWVDYRTAWGGDRVFGEFAGQGSTGVRVMRPHPTQPRGSLLLDMVADDRLGAGPTDWFQALPQGSTFTSRGGSVRITVLSADARTARVRLQTAPFADAAGPAPTSRGTTGEPQAAQDPGTPPPAAPSTEQPRLLLNTDQPVEFGTRAYATIVGRPGAPVELHSRLYPSTGFTRIRHGLALGPDGTLSIPTAPNRNLRLMARYADTGVQSGQPLVQVATVTSVSGVGFTSRTVTFRGSSRPARAGQVVEIREGARVLGRGATTSSGAYAITFAHPGGCRSVRAVSVVTGYNAASESGTGRLCT